MSIKPSASLLVLAQNSLLFMRRPSHGTFPSVHAFPGGAVEQTDPHTTYCALRETFEETGLLISPHLKGGHVVVRPVDKYPSYERAVELLTGKDAKAGINWSDPESIGLKPISTWVTPPTQKRRFRAQFYVYHLDPSVSATPFRVDDVPKSREVDVLEWLTPTEAVAEFEAGRINLMPPQFYLLDSIIREGVDGAVSRLRNRVVEPAFVRVLDDGRTEMDWGQGEKGVVTFGKPSGIIKAIEIIYPARSRL